MGFDPADALHDFIVGGATIAGEAGKGITDMGNAIGDFATGTVNAIGDGFNAAGKAVGDGFNAAGQFVNDGVKAVGDGFNAAGQFVNDGVNAAGDAIVGFGEDTVEYWTGTAADAQEGFNAGLSGEEAPVNDALTDVRESYAKGQERYREWVDDRYGNVESAVESVADTVTDTADQLQQQTQASGPEM